MFENVQPWGYTASVIGLALFFFVFRKEIGFWKSNSPSHVSETESEGAFVRSRLWPGLKKAIRLDRWNNLLYLKDYDPVRVHWGVNFFLENPDVAIPNPKGAIYYYTADGITRTPSDPIMQARLSERLQKEHENERLKQNPTVAKIQKQQELADTAETFKDILKSGKGGGQRE